MGKSHSRGKDPDLPQKDHLVPPDPMFTASKAADGDPDRPPVPTPRNRSFTCSEKPHPPTPVSPLTSVHKKPVVPSRSEGGMVNNRPPLPAKSRPGPPEPQTTKPRDYRDSSELPSKLRLPARPGQPQPHKDSKESFICLELTDKYNSYDDANSVFLQRILKFLRWAVLWSEISVSTDCAAFCPASPLLARRTTDWVAIHLY